MLRSLFILMLVALMAAVGLYYENQADKSQAAVEDGTDSILVAATAVRKYAEPDPAGEIDCASTDHSGNASETPQADDICINAMDEETINIANH